MKVEEKTLDFKFLNIAMYVAFGIILCIFFKNIGVLDKLVEVVVSLAPVYIGIIICWISTPLANLLRKLGLGKSISAFLSLIIIIGVVIALFSVLVPMLISQVSELVKEFPQIYNNIVDKINEIASQKFGIESEIEYFQTVVNKDVLIDNFDSILSYSISTLQSVISVIVTIATSFVVSFFMVKDMGKFKLGVKRLITQSENGKRKYKMFIDIEQAVMSYIRGTFIDSIVVGILTTIMCMILGIDYAFVFGILITTLNFVPYIGALISEVLMSLYALTVGGPVLAIVTLACALLIQMIDANILQPNIIAKSVDLHPVVVIGGLIVFQLLFGVIGMVIAVPVLAGIKIWLEYKFSMQFEEVFAIDTEIKKKIKFKENLGNKNK